MLSGAEVGVKTATRKAPFSKAGVNVPVARSIIEREK
jgi:hypothetical protein